MIDNLVRDFRFAIRQLWTSPGFTCTVVFTLALGMCASVAIFAFADAALLKPLPYRDAGRLVGVFETIAATSSQANLSYLDYLDWKRLNNVFSTLDVYQRNSAILATREGPQLAFYGRVSDGFFRTLGVTPILGRDFYAGEDLPEAPRTILLSYAAWQKRYGLSRDAIGQRMDLDGVAYTIIGVLPRNFQFAPSEPAEFWMTLNATGSCERRRSCHNLSGVGRLNPGATFGSALANVKLVAQQLEKQYPDSNHERGAMLMPLTEVIAGDVRPVLVVLMSGVVLLLLIACLNIASLLLVRSENRNREMAVRGALGASAARLFMQFATEGVLLVIAGGGIGLVAGRWVMHLLANLIPVQLIGRMPYLDGLGLNLHVLIFAGTVMLLGVLLFSVTPMVRLPASEILAGMAQASRGSSGVVWRKTASRLVAIELATAVILLTGAGLLGKSFYLLLKVDIGLEPRHLATLNVSAPGSNYTNDAKRLALQREVMSSVAALPGVESVGLAGQLPVSNNGNTIWFRVLGKPFHGEHNDLPQRQVSTGYFETVKAKLLKGRLFAATDDASRPLVVIVNRALQRQYFGGEDPVGQQIVYLFDGAKPMDIIGVVDDIKEGPLDSQTPPVIYVPFNQAPRSDFVLVARTGQTEDSLLPAIAAAVRQIDPGIVTWGGSSMNESINNAQSTYLHRSSAWLVGGFAGTALLLGVIGLYGMMAYSVNQRRREIGIRMALGAQRDAVYKLVLKEAVQVTAIGAIAGVALSIAGAAMIRKMLFGTPPWDALTLASVTTVLMIASLLASYIPLRRAASVSPVEVLRAD